MSEPTNHCGGISADCADAADFDPCLSAFIRVLFSAEWKTAVGGRGLGLGGLADKFLAVPGYGRASFRRAAIADDL